MVFSIKREINGQILSIPLTAEEQEQVFQLQRKLNTREDVRAKLGLLSKEWEWAADMAKQYSLIENIADEAIEIFLHSDMEIGEAVEEAIMRKAPKGN